MVFQSKYLAVYNGNIYRGIIEITTTTTTTRETTNGIKCFFYIFFQKCDLSRKKTLGQFLT